MTPVTPMMDSFLHLPPSLYKKLFAGKESVPVVSVIKDSKEEEVELMWAVENEAASANLKVRVAFKLAYLIVLASALFNRFMQRIIFPF